MKHVWSCRKSDLKFMICMHAHIKHMHHRDIDHIVFSLLIISSSHMTLNMYTATLWVVFTEYVIDVMRLHAFVRLWSSIYVINIPMHLVVLPIRSSFVMPLSLNVNPVQCIHKSNKLCVYKHTADLDPVSSLQQLYNPFYCLHTRYILKVHSPVCDFVLIYTFHTIKGEHI